MAPLGGGSQAPHGISEDGTWVTEQPERGTTAWGWVVRIGSFGMFVYIGVFRGSTVNFGIAFLAISAAALPIKELGIFLKSWRNKQDGGQ
jgi:hypothetical protein